MEWHWASCYPFLSLSHIYIPFLSIPFLFTFSYGLHIVCRQHALLASTLHSSIHPPFIDWLHVHNHISVEERHFILIGCGVVIHCPVTFLKMSKCTDIRQKKKKRCRETGIVQERYIIFMGGNPYGNSKNPTITLHLQARGFSTHQWGSISFTDEWQNSFDIHSPTILKMWSQWLLPLL